MALLPHTPTTNTTKSGSTVIGQPYTPPQAWTSWVVPSIIIVNIAVFAYSLYVDNCIGSRHACSDDCCVFTFLHRFAFEPLSVNPFLGPIIETLVFSPPPKQGNFSPNLLYGFSSSRDSWSYHRIFFFYTKNYSIYFCHDFQFIFCSLDFGAYANIILYPFATGSMLWVL